MVKVYLNDINSLARLPKLIVKSHPRGYVGSVIEGPRGKGKSVFCLKTGRQVFQYAEGITRDDAWERVLDNVIFSINEVGDLFDIIDKIDWNNPSRISEWFENETHIFKIWDDAGMHGGKYKYQSETLAVDNLLGNLDVIRFVLTGFMINAPEMANLLKFIREYHDHLIIKIMNRAELGMKYERRAIFRTWQEDKLGRWKLKKSPPHTPFSCWMGAADRLGINDQWVYDKFEIMKANAIKENRDKFRKMAKIASKSEPDKDPYEVIGVPEKYKSLIEES